jgi:hypothetical protein
MRSFFGSELTLHRAPPPQKVRHLPCLPSPIPGVFLLANFVIESEVVPRNPAIAFCDALGGATTNDGARDQGECEMNVGSSFVTGGETAKPGDPGESPLDDPSAFSEMGAALDAFSGDAMFDAAVSAGSATVRVIVSFVGVEFSRAATWASTLAADDRNGVKEWLEHPAVMNISATQQDAE